MQCSAPIAANDMIWYDSASSIEVEWREDAYRIARTIAGSFTVPETPGNRVSHNGD